MSKKNGCIYLWKLLRAWPGLTGLCTTGPGQTGPAHKVRVEVSRKNSDLNRAPWVPTSGLPHVVGPSQRRCYSNFSRLFPKILQTDTTCFYSSTRSSEQNWFLSVHWLSNCVPIKSTVASIALETWKSHKILGHQIPWTPNTRDTKYYGHKILWTQHTRDTKYHGH